MTLSGESVMSGKSKPSKALGDLGAWFFNVTTSVGIIMVNKQVMSIYKFGFATTLTGLHFLMTSVLAWTLMSLGLLNKTHLPIMDLVNFILCANFSIVGMNVSLMWNSVGFYQIAKLSMIPVSCLLEMVLDRVRYSSAVKASILFVLMGVGVCTVTDVSVNTSGFIAAAIAVWSTALQQYYVHALQKKHNLGSFDLLGHTAPLQALSLLVTGPLVDYWLNGVVLHKYEFSSASVFFIFLSCVIAVGVNASQFLCIGRFSAVTFQVLGHMKTLLVLALGFYFFGRDGFDSKVLIGMGLAVIGMVWYGNVIGKPGAKVVLPSTPMKSSVSGPAYEKVPQISEGEAKV